MIKANELRIGNLVYKQSNKLINDISEIFRLKVITPQECHKYLPISLTPEILKECGFEYRDDTVPKRWNKKMYDQNSIWYLYEDLDGGISFSPYNWNYTLKVTSLHQLQNLCFSLTREELEIRL